MPNFCPECGKAVESTDHKYCPECGQEMRVCGRQQASSPDRDVAGTPTPKRRRWVFALMGVGAVLLVAYLTAVPPSFVTHSEESEFEGVSDIVFRYDSTEDYRSFLVRYQDGTEEILAITRDDRILFEVIEAGDGDAESVTVTTVTSYDTRFFGLMRGDVRGVRWIYHLVLEPADYDYYWSIPATP